MNPTNLGAIFRSAAALNMDAILLTPECTNPLYRRAIRVSMGTVFQIPWTIMVGEQSSFRESISREQNPNMPKTLTENQTLFRESVAAEEQKLRPESVAEVQSPWPKTVMEELRKQGFKTVAMALRKDTIEIDDPKLKNEEKLAIILGTEGDGLAEETIDGCDYTVKIPMSHGVDSLNVAAASAIAFWELGR